VGTNLTYGHTSAVVDASSFNPGMSNVVVSTAIGPVSFGTIHYRAAASNSLGQAVGEDLTFDTTRLGVNSLADYEPGSLRYVLSNALPETTVFVSAVGTIALTNGELVIDRNVRIQGLGADRLAISGSLTSRVLRISSGVSAHISGLTIRTDEVPMALTGPTV